MTTTTTTAREIGTRIGKAIARDVIADDLPIAWTGLDATDGDQLLDAGFSCDTADWAAAEDAAEKSYKATLAAHCRARSLPTSSDVIVDVPATLNLDDDTVALIRHRTDGGRCLWCDDEDVAAQVVARVRDIIASV